MTLFSHPRLNMFELSQAKQSLFILQPTNDQLTFVLTFPIELYFTGSFSIEFLQLPNSIVCSAEGRRRRRKRGKEKK